MNTELKKGFRVNEEGDLKPLGTCCAHIGFISGTFGPYLTF